MRGFRSGSRLISWVASVVILSAAVMPAWSHVGVLVPGNSWADICTSQGTQLIQAAEDGLEHTPPLGYSPERCPYCLVHALAIGLPPAAATALLSPSLRHECPPACLFVLRTPHAWVNALPRAPPAHS